MLSEESLIMKIIFNFFFISSTMKIYKPDFLTKIVVCDGE